MRLKACLTQTGRAFASYGDTTIEVYTCHYNRQGFPVMDVVILQESKPGVHGISGTLPEIERFIQGWDPDMPEIEWETVEAPPGFVPYQLAPSCSPSE